MDPSGETREQLKERLLAEVPESGEGVGNSALMRSLGWSGDQYWDIRGELIDDEVLERRRGRGGSVRRIVALSARPAPTVLDRVEDAMSKVGRAHPPERWPGWACTREDFARLMQTMVDLIVLPPDPDVVVRITMPAFERPFESIAEFQDNTSEDDWIHGKSISGVIRGPGVTITLDFYPWTGASLSVEGGQRRDRNAVFPDLEAAVSQHARQAWAEYLPTALAMALCAGPPGVILSVYVLTSLFNINVVTLVLLILLLFGSLFPGALLSERWDRVFVRSEFLGDDAISTPEREKRLLARLARRVAVAVVGLATIAGALFAYLSLKR